MDGLIYMVYNGTTLLKWMIWRYPHFWKHPYISWVLKNSPRMPSTVITRITKVDLLFESSVVGQKSLKHLPTKWLWKMVMLPISESVKKLSENLITNTRLVITICIRQLRFPQNSSLSNFNNFLFSPMFYPPEPSHMGKPPEAWTTHIVKCYFAIHCCWWKQCSCSHSYTLRRTNISHRNHHRKCLEVGGYCVMEELRLTSW